MIACVTTIGGFPRPKDVPCGFVAVAAVQFVIRATAVRGLAHELSPVVRSVRVVTELICGERGKADCGGAVQMAVYRRQLRVVVTVRAGVAEIVRVVHAGVLVGTVLARMPEAERMTKFLTHHMSAVRVIISTAVKVGVVHLRRTLRYMNSAGDIYRREPQPAVEAVGRITGANLSADHRAPFTCVLSVAARYPRHIKDRRPGPVG